MMANISAAHTALPNVVPIIMNMELVEDIGSEIFCVPPAVGSGIFCDPPGGLGVGEGIEDGTENVGELEGVGEEDIGNGVEDDGEPETDKENSSAISYSIYISLVCKLQTHQF